MLGNRRAGASGRGHRGRSVALNNGRGGRRLGLERLEDRRMLSGQSLLVAPAPPVYGPIRPPVIAPVNAGKYSIAIVSGLSDITSVAWGRSITGPGTGFVLSGAPVGATYTFSVTSSGGGTPITGSGAVGSTSPQYVLGINVAMMPNGTLT